MTYSIVAYDPAEREWGVAVASKFLGAGALVSWARADAGAVATQALAKVSYGPDGLALLAEGHSARDTLAQLLSADPQVAARQVGIVDHTGGAAAHTGPDCHDWAGHHVGDHFTCQGNILAGPGVLEAMAAAFIRADGELADRLVAALAAGEAAGGDRRGRQSAAVLVVRAGGGYGGDNDRYLDLRVDDDPQPVQKLAHLVGAHHLFFGIPRAEDQIAINDGLARELQALLRRAGYYSGPPSGRWDEGSKRAFWRLVGNENLEERWSLHDRPDFIDRVALEYLRGRFPA